MAKWDRLWINARLATMRRRFRDYGAIFAAVNRSSRRRNTDLDLTGLAHDRGSAVAVRRQEHDLRPPYALLRGVPLGDDDLQPNDDSTAHSPTRTFATPWESKIGLAC